MQVLRKFWPRAVAGHGGSRLFSAAAGPSIVTSPGKGIGQVVVIGGGAIGSLFAGRIACNKNLKDQVWLLTSWEDQASVIDRTEGLIVKESGTAGDSLLLGSVRSARSLRDILDLKSHPQHPIKLGLGSVVIIATKQAGVRRAAEQAAQFLSATRGGICVALQNGWGHMEVISAALKYHEAKSVLLQGVYSGGAYMEGAGVVVHSGVGDLAFGVQGPQPDDLSAGLLKEFSGYLESGGLPNHIQENVPLLAWEKLCTNAAINAVTAVLRVKNGALLDSTAAMDLMKSVSMEAHQVGIEVLRPTSGENDSSWTSFKNNGWEACYKRAMTVAERTSGNTSSMLADVLNKKKTEIEYINGTIVREGLKHGISTPANQVLLSLVRASYDLANIRMQHIQDQS